jgi:hypothetical protein
MEETTHRGGGGERPHTYTKMEIAAVAITCIALFFAAVTAHNLAFMFISGLCFGGLMFMCK